MIGYFGFPAPVMTPEATRAAANATADLVEPEQPRVQVPATMPAPKLEYVDRAKLSTAALRARRAYPGPVGQEISEILTAWSEFGFRFGGDGRIARLVDAVMAVPFAELDLPPAA